MVTDGEIITKKPCYLDPAEPTECWVEVVAALLPESMQYRWMSSDLVTSSVAISAPDCSSMDSRSSSRHLSSCSPATRDTSASFSSCTRPRLWPWAG